MVPDKQALRALCGHPHEHDRAWRVIGLSADFIITEYNDELTGYPALLGRMYPEVFRYGGNAYYIKGEFCRERGWRVEEIEKPKSELRGLFDSFKAEDPEAFDKFKADAAGKTPWRIHPAALAKAVEAVGQIPISGVDPSIHRLERVRNKLDGASITKIVETAIEKYMEYLRDVR